jgi:hypothetical protein
VYCVAEGTGVELVQGVSVPIELVEVGDLVHGLADDSKGLTGRPVTAVMPRGERPCIELLFNDGRTLTCTPDHRILTAAGQWVEARDLIVDESEVSVGPTYPLESARVRYAVPRDLTSMPMFKVKLVGRRAVGVKNTFDLSVDGPADVEPAFTANGIVVHNCRECALELCGVVARGRCCICRAFFSPLSLMAVPLPSPVIDIDFEAEFKHSAKTQRLMEEIDQLKREDPTIKSLIFSQWTSMLDLIQIPLKKQGYKFLRLDGSDSRSSTHDHALSLPSPRSLTVVSLFCLSRSLNQKQREVVLHQFKTDPSVTLLLISLKAGGVGLNLVSASCVFFIDAWWNPAVEQQAIDRVHRIGQTRTVRVKRFVIIDSVEERILEMQERKVSRRTVRCSLHHS